MKDGVSWYSRYTISIYFPEQPKCCKLCPLFETYSRAQCRATGEYIGNEYAFGGHCPLVEVEDKTELPKMIDEAKALIKRLEELTGGN